MAIRAVITGDIVNSTRLSKASQKKLMAGMYAVLEGHKYEFYRGDSFQVIVKAPEEALLISFLLKAVAIKLPTEIDELKTDIKASIGIGMVDIPVKTLKTASGEAFIISGRGFDQMRPNQKLVVGCGEKNQVLNLGLRVLGEFADYIFQRLTTKQAAVVFELLQNRTQTEAAKKLKKSQATINKHTQSAGWSEIEKLLVEYRQFINSIEP